MKEDHHQDKFRVNSTSNEYWMIENGYLRLVPDLTTLEALHHFRMSVDDKGHDVHTDPLTPMDLTAYPIGMALPSRKDLQQIDIGDDMPIVNDADPKIWETVKERRAKRKEVHQLGGGGGSKNIQAQHVLYV